MITRQYLEYGASRTDKAKVDVEIRSKVGNARLLLSEKHVFFLQRNCLFFKDCHNIVQLQMLLPHQQPHGDALGTC